MSHDQAAFFVILGAFLAAALIYAAVDFATEVRDAMARPVDEVTR